VLYVPELKKNLLSISVMKDKGFVIVIKKGQVLICPEGASPDTVVSIGVKESRLYRLQGKHIHGSKGILDHGSMSVTEDEEQKAPKREQSSQTSSSRSQHSGGKELAPSSFVRRPTSYELKLMDAQEQVEAPRSTLRDSNSPKKFLNFMALICYIIEEAVV
jgi:hypothetical protein